MIYDLQHARFWLDETVDTLLTYLEEQGYPKDKPITCAAGMTPSCPIHFGIFREIAISSFVADELQKRGKKVRLVYYWDDFDHFCKIPYYTTKDKVKEHIGKSLRKVPDFNGNYSSYGEHYMRSFEKCLHKTGFFPHYNYQSELYTSGFYKDYILKALNRRDEIFDIIASTHREPIKNAEVLKKEFYPVEVYCENCGTDSTKVTAWNKKSKILQYSCKKCNHEGSYTVDNNFNGKLIWKVNWATRWADDSVCFESSGENQLTDTGSYSVASKITETLFDSMVPYSLLYRFIGTPGIAKTSRKEGEKSLATTLVKVVEPAIIRWLLVKNTPNKHFSINLEQGIFRLYHEWDLFEALIKNGTASPVEKRIYDIAIKNVEKSQITIPFKILTTSLCITHGDMELAAKLLLKLVNYKGIEKDFLKKIEPRMKAARAWLYDCKNIKNEPHLQTVFNKEAWDAFDDKTKECIDFLFENIDSCTKEEEFSTMLYYIPKKILLLKDDALPTKELQQLQKKFFKGLYQLLLGSTKGPKLATLLMLLEVKTLKTLLRGIRHDK